MAKSTKSENKRRYSSDGFLEAFRDLGGNFAGTFKDQVIKDTGKGIFDALSGNFDTSNDSQPAKTESGKPDFEQKYRQQIQRQGEIIRREEKILYTRAERDTKLHLQALQQEIQQLVKASDQLSKEVEIASFTLPAESGVYHLNFFEKLRALIRALKSKIQESSIWLAEWNKKSKKKNYYWSQANKSGSKFMLSADRQVSTQTG